MAGYSQMNRGYDEQPGVNWGSIAAWTAGGLVAAGSMRMGMQAFNKAARRGAGATRRMVRSGGNRIKGIASDFREGMRGPGVSLARPSGYGANRRNAANVASRTVKRGHIDDINMAAKIRSHDPFQRPAESARNAFLNRTNPGVSGFASPRPPMIPPQSTELHPAFGVMNGRPGIIPQQRGVHADAFSTPRPGMVPSQMMAIRHPSLDAFSTPRPAMIKPQNMRRDPMHHAF